MYFFLEEKTPVGYTIKIMPSSWQFIVFDKRGNSVDIYGDSNKFTHNLPLIIFVGQKFKIKQDYTKQYWLVKIRDGSMIVPYIDGIIRKKRYAFIKTDVNIDILPIRIICVPNISVMMKTVDSKIVPDYTLVDNSVSNSDIYIISNRYHAQNVINVDEKTNIESFLEDNNDDYVFDNLNMYSQNPLFLAAAHLRAMDFSKLNQLLFDFQFTPVDLEAVLSYINAYTKKDKFGQISAHDLNMLTLLRARVNFYLQLLIDESAPEISAMIEHEYDLNMLHSFKDLVVKVKLFTTDEHSKEILNNYEELLNKRSKEITGAVDTLLTTP